MVTIIYSKQEDKRVESCWVGGMGSCIRLELPPAWHMLILLVLIFQGAKGETSTIK